MAPGHLLIDVDVTRTDWRVNAGTRFGGSGDVGHRPVPLFVSYTPNYQPAPSELAADLVSLAENIIAICLRNPDEPCPGGVTLELARAIFSRVLPGVPLAAAPLTNFADMNRFRPPAEFGTCVPLCPQVHTFDVDSMMEKHRTADRCAADRARIQSGPADPRRSHRPEAPPPAGCTAGLAFLRCVDRRIARNSCPLRPCRIAHLPRARRRVNGVLGTPTAEVIEALAAIDRVAAVKSSAPVA